MTLFIDVFNWLSNAGFTPSDYTYEGGGVIRTSRFSYEPKIGDYVTVSYIATTAGMVTWAYCADKTKASGIVMGAGTLRGDPYHRTQWQVQLLLPQGQEWIV